jgi:hypothetical protein
MNEKIKENSKNKNYSITNGRINNSVLTNICSDTKVNIYYNNITK